MALSINDTKLRSIECHYAESHYAECHIFIVMLSVIMMYIVMLNAIMLYIVMLSVIMLNVVAPKSYTCRIQNYTCKRFIGYAVEIVSFNVN
jgi:hypothetical protein